MALVAQVKDGQLVESASQSSLSKTGATQSKNSLDKEAFLQLLVAQMQYQDPLEPTSNTEYVSQYAQFSQVEEMQNMAAGMELQRASSLVGQEVYIKTTSKNGETSYVQGKVDYVVFENNKAYLSINEELYSIDDLDTVVDAQYQVAYDKAYGLTVAMNKLPAVNSISLTDGEKIDELAKIYNEMSDYEKKFVAEETEKKLKAYIERIEILRKGEEENTEV